MTKRKCNSYDAKFKAKIALEAVEGKKETLEISADNNIPKSTILEWKDKLMKNAIEIFIPQNEKDKQLKKARDELAELQRIIGEITIENNFLKKKLQK